MRQQWCHCALQRAPAQPLFLDEHSSPFLAPPSTRLPAQERLHALYLLGLPAALRWVLPAALPAAARAKLRICSADSPEMPVTVAKIVQRCA